MDVEEVRRNLESAISEAVSAHGAQLDEQSRRELSAMASRAASAIVNSDEAESDAEMGSVVYRGLVDDMVTLARKSQQFPLLGKDTLESVLRVRGPNPPYWGELGRGQ